MVEEIAREDIIRIGEIEIRGATHVQDAMTREVVINVGRVMGIEKAEIVHEGIMMINRGKAVINQEEIAKNTKIGIREATGKEMSKEEIAMDILQIVIPRIRRIIMKIKDPEDPEEISMSR